MEIKHSDNLFYFGDSNDPDGKLTYVVDEDVYTIDSVVVNPDLRGQGLGDVLLDHAADYARENNIKLIGKCPFVAKRFKQHPEKYSDVIYQQ
ncbi:MAG TPA: N-acetyltransferase [Candidatus Jeotgalicoccus stercoravium]|nr:N-acetyltransferase [Candidatus Jeotgalicoccus stercoravium]